MSLLEEELVVGGVYGGVAEIGSIGVVIPRIDPLVAWLVQGGRQFLLALNCEADIRWSCLHVGPSGK